MTISKAFLSGKIINEGAPSAIEFLDDGVHVADSAISIDFVGDSVQATTDGVGNISVNISNNAVDSSWAAPLDSPALTGIPTAPTPAAGTNTNQIATAEFVTAAISGATAPVTSVAGRTGNITLAVTDISGAAPLNSPTLTGTPTAPTATTGTNTTQIATTAFVAASVVAAGGTTVTNSTPAAETVGDTGAVGIATTAARADHRHAMPAAATTVASGFMSATDKTKLDGIQSGAQVNAVTSVAGRTGVVTLAVADVSGAAPLDSPALTGTPTAPTAVAGTNTTQLASTAFVTTAVNSVALPSQTGNSGKFLSTNGSTASWATVVGGGGSGTVTSVAATVPAFMSVSGSPITASGTLAFSLSGSALPASSGGTGQTSYAVGDLLYAGTTTTLAKLPDVATGNALISGGVGAAPSWGKVGLTTHVSGTLPVGNGGTGVTTLTGLVKANGASAFTAAVAGVDYISPSSELDGGTF